jgi:hypothetical protein
MADNYRRVTINRHLTKSSSNSDELTEDLKNDLQLAFNIYKNEENKINKLKLRTILFSFAMYKSSPRQINEYIAEFFPKQEEFTFENLLKLVFYKLKNIKETEADSLFNIINGGKTQFQFSKDDMSKAFGINGIEISEREVTEMVAFMTGTGDKNVDDVLISKEDFKKFLI